MLLIGVKTALKPSAASLTENEDAGYYLFTAATAASLGIYIDDNESGRQAIDGFYEYIGKSYDEYWNEVLVDPLTFNNPPVGAVAALEVRHNVIQYYTSAMYDYFVTYRGASSADYTIAELLNENGVIGFTSDSQFCFTIGNGNPFQYNHILLGKCTLTIGNCVKAIDLLEKYPQVFPYLGELTNQVTSSGTLVPTASLIRLQAEDGFSWVQIGWSKTYINADDDSNWSRYDCSGTYTSKSVGSNNPPYSFTCNNNRSMLGSFVIGRNPSINQFTNEYQSGTNNAFCDSFGNVYDLVQNDNGKYVFTNYIFDVLWYDGKEFDSTKDAINYFFKQCGLTLPSAPADTFVTPTLPNNDNPGVSIPDPDDTERRVRDIDNRNDNDPMYIIFPGTPDILKYQQDNPDSVIVDEGDDELFPDLYKLLYDLEIDIPLINGDVWKKKFPFCLPFDLYNMFAGVSRNAVAPHFNFVVMPKDSFGLNLDSDFIVDVNFSDYSYIVKIMRFFEVALFTVGLIILTRKLIE